MRTRMKADSDITKPTLIGGKHGILKLSSRLDGRLRRSELAVINLLKSTWHNGRTLATMHDDSRHIAQGAN